MTFEQLHDESWHQAGMQLFYVSEFHTPGSHRVLMPLTLVRDKSTAQLQKCTEDSLSFPYFEHPLAPLNPPVACLLSDDVVLLVFLDLAGRSHESFKSALAISQTCSRWRTLAIEHCPQLWHAHALRVPRSSKELIIFKRSKLPAFNQELVRRSHGLDLQFGWDEVMPCMSGIPAILRCSHQLGWLSLSSTVDWRSEGPNKALDYMTKARAPRLKHLELSGFKHDLPSTIFTGNLSSLTSLTLFQSWIDIDKTNIGQNLMEFSVTRPPWFYESATTFPDDFGRWLNILQRMPHLRALELNLTCRLRRLGAPETIDPSLHITLPCLVQIDITLPLSHFEHLLDHVSLPSCRKVRLEISDSIPESSQSLSLHNRIKELSTRHVLPSPGGLRLRFFETKSVSYIHSCYTHATFVLSPSGVPDDWDEAPVSTNHNIILSLPGPQDGALTAVSLVIGAWLAIDEHITSLSIASFSPECAPAIIAFIAGLRHLRTVVCTEKGLEMLRQEPQGSSQKCMDGILQLRPELRIVVRKEE